MTSTADGSVAITVDLNVDEAEKEVARLRKKIIDLESGLNESKSKRNALVEKLKEAEDAYISLHQTAQKDKNGFLLPADAEALEQAEANIARIKDQIEKTDEAIAKGTVALDAAKNTQSAYIAEADRLAEIKQKEAALEQAAEEAGRAHLQTIAQSAEVADQHIIDLQNELAQLSARQNELRQAGVGLGYQEYDQIEQKIAEINAQLREYRKNLQQSGEAARDAADAVDEMANSGKKAGGFMDKLGSRILGLAKRVFVFSLITSALRAMRTYLGNAIKANDEASAAFSRLKGALLTLAQPLIEILIPALTTLANILTVIVTSIASVLSGLFGKTAKQSASAAKGLYGEADAIGSVGSAAEEATGSLAGFDEINTIQTENAGGGGGGGGGGGAGGTEMPDFSLDSGITDRLKEIADLVMLIGAGLALWKIGKMLPGVLGQIATVLGGILMTVGGLLLFWNGLTDAWENGVDWLNLTEMIGGLAAAAFGLYTIFSMISPTIGKFAAGIALVVGGILMLVTAFHDAMENGWNLQNTLLAIAGILATGIGLSFITKSVIPGVIAAIAALLLAFTVATGHGEELINGIKLVIEGFSEFFSGVFSGDMEKAAEGIKKIWEGLKTAAGAILAGIKDAFLAFYNWLDEKTNGKLSTVVNTIIALFKAIGAAVQVVWNTIKSFWDSYIQPAIDTMAKFITDIFTGVKNSVQKILTGIVQFIEGIFTNDFSKAWEGVKNIFKGVWNGIISILESAANLIIRGINWIISQINKLSFTAPSWVPQVGGKTIGFNIPSLSSISIPRLAQGAVIPPNREFMAVLGDQSSGTNVEAPLDTIKQALVEALRESGLNSGGDIHITVDLDGAVVARKTVKHINDMTRQSGKSVLLF